MCLDRRRCRIKKKLLTTCSNEIAPSSFTIYEYPTLENKITDKLENTNNINYQSHTSCLDTNDSFERATCSTATASNWLFCKFYFILWLYIHMYIGLINMESFLCKKYFAGPSIIDIKPEIIQVNHNDDLINALGQNSAFETNNYENGNSKTNAAANTPKNPLGE